MLKINTLAAIGLTAALLISPLSSFAADTDAMMMAPKDAMMAKDSMHKDAMMMTNQKAYSAEAFKAAAATGKPFVVAFHKKGCALCAAQQKALDAAYADPAFKDVAVLVVAYPTDSTAIEQFKVSEQGTLIVFTGEAETSRSQKLTSAAAIIAQLKS